MIIRTNRLTEHTEIKEENGQIIMNKAINLDPYLKNAYELKKDEQNGWSKDRSFRKIGSVPMEAFVIAQKLHPEIVCGDHNIADRKILELFKKDWEPFKTVDKI